MTNDHLGQDVHSVKKWDGVKRIRDVKNDYKKLVPKLLNDLTKQSTALLNKSIESFVYCILGAQAETKQSIYGNRTSLLETQQVFRQVVEDSIIHYDTSVSIISINRAISDTNAVFKYGCFS